MFLCYSLFVFLFTSIIFWLCTFSLSLKLSESSFSLYSADCVHSFHLQILPDWFSFSYMQERFTHFLSSFSFWFTSCFNLDLSYLSAALRCCRGYLLVLRNMIVFPASWIAGGKEHSTSWEDGCEWTFSCIPEKIVVLFITKCAVIINFHNTSAAVDSRILLVVPRLFLTFKIFLFLSWPWIGLNTSNNQQAA